MRLRSVLVWPPTFSHFEETIIHVPENILQLATFLKNYGYETSYVDLTLELDLHNKETFYNVVKSEKKSKEYLEKSIKIVEREDPNILCIGGWSSHLPFILEFIRNYKARNPNCFIIFGGYPPTFTPTEVLQILPEIDVLIRGESELTLLEMLQKLSRGENWHSTKGISFISNNKIVHNSDRELIKNLDELPFPDLSDFINKAKRKRKKKIYFYLSTARGCNFNCRFCLTTKVYKCLRKHSPKYVIKKIKHYQNYGAEYISFIDETITYPNKWIEKLCYLLQHDKIDMTFDCSTRIDTVSLSLVKRMANVGFKQILYGLESVNPTILSYINKTSNPEKYILQAKKIIPKTAELMNVKVSVIIGFPFEDKKSMLKTINFFNGKQNVKTIFTPLIIFPKTDLWKEYLNGKIKVEPIKSKELLQFAPARRILFYNKYCHLFWCVPEAWLPKNETMTQEEFESFICNQWKKSLGLL